MTKKFAPLLSQAVDFDQLDYTNLWLSPKYDCIRAVIREGVVMSRKLLPIPNAHVQKLYGGRPSLEGYDGELIVGYANAPDVYSKTYSGVMSRDGAPDVQFFAFDHTAEPTKEYCTRRDSINSNERGIFKVPQHPVESLVDVLRLEEVYLGMGYEGVMLRSFQGPTSMYKFGRSTSKANTLLKLKRLEDFEAEIVGYEEEMFNGNEATVDELGHTKRSSHAENKTGKGTLGKLICRYGTSDLTFKVGIFKGMTAADKLALWLQRESLPGQWAKLQKLPIGEKDRPRHPRTRGGLAFLGPRSTIDM